MTNGVQVYSFTPTYDVCRGSNYKGLIPELLVQGKKLSRGKFFDGVTEGSQVSHLEVEKFVDLKSRDL